MSDICVTKAKNMNKVFFNETSLNGKFEVMSNVELQMPGIIKVGSNSILTHKGEIYKNLLHYWVTKDALDEIKQTLSPVRTSF